MFLYIPQQTTHIPTYKPTQHPLTFNMCILMRPHPWKFEAIRSNHVINNYKNKTILLFKYRIKIPTAQHNMYLAIIGKTLERIPGVGDISGIRYRTSIRVLIMNKNI